MLESTFAKGGERGSRVVYEKKATCKISQSSCYRARLALDGTYPGPTEFRLDAFALAHNSRPRTTAKQLHMYILTWVHR